MFACIAVYQGIVDGRAHANKTGVTKLMITSARGTNAPSGAAIGWGRTGVDEHGGSVP